MKTSSAKAKGRRACKAVQDAILEVFPELTPDDVRVTSSGVTGEDLLLSPRAQELLPFTFEVKNQESISIWAALDQAKTHAMKRPGSVPLLVFTRNRGTLQAALPLASLLSLARLTPNRTNEKNDKRELEPEA